MSNRILGLDALRFLCALCVVQGHLRLAGYLLLDRLHGPQPLVDAVRKAFNMGFPIPTGPNAVIVFFVISGFCIHFPYRNKKIDVQQFVVRRYIRVGLPALLATAIFYRSGFYSIQSTVLWSVICEIIYYGLYPLLMILRDRLGWRTLVVGSFAVAYLVVAQRRGGPYVGDFPSFGLARTWILGLPCWLLGCLLAERYERFRPHGRTAQWIFRLGIIAAATVATTLRFHANIGYYWSEPLLAIPIYFWLGTEIAYFTAKRPWAWLERAGSWSYSLYLYHSPLANIVGGWIGLQFGLSCRTLLEVGAVLAGCYLLHRLVERPAHALARRYAASARNARAVPATT